VWLGSRETKDEKEQDRRRYQKKRERGDKSYLPHTDAISGSLEAVADEFDSYRKEQRHHDRKNTLLEVAGVTAAFTAAAFALYSAWIFQGQLEEARIENRPWIKIVSVDPADLQWLPEKFRSRDVDGWAMMAPKITILNVGKSPAFAVQAAAWSFISPKHGESVLDARRRDCGYLRDGKTPRGPILFPGEGDAPSHTGWGVRGFSISRKAIENAETNIENGAPTFSFFVVGCADYMFGSPPTHHQTYFWFEAVHLIRREGQPTGISGSFRVGEDIPASEILFMRMEAGNDAN
jgi:hypothetical protein